MIRTEEFLNMDHDSYDSSQFDKIKNRAQILKGTLDKGKKDLQIFPQLIEDLFYTFYKYNPQMKPPSKVNPIFQLNRNLLFETVSDPNFDQLRTNTKLDELNASVAAASMGEALLTDHAEEIAEIQGYVKDVKSAAQSIQKIGKEQQLIQANMKNAPPSQKNQLVKQNNQLDKQKQQQFKNMQKAQQGSKSAQTQLIKSGGVGSAIKQAKQAISLQNDFFESWGSGTGIFKPVSYEERIQMSQQLLLNKKLRKIAQLAGRFRRFAAKKQREKTKHSVEEVSDIHQSNDISRLITSELILLILPELEDYFYKKYAERELLTYELSGFESKGKGPLIICIDVSGSMGGDRDIWCKATSLALVDIAHREKRNAIVIPFDDDVQTVFEFYKDNYSLATVLEMASFFSGGGTNFDPPLLKAMEYLEKESKLEKGDIIMVTDGASNLSDHVKAQVEELKVKLKFSIFTVVIGSEFGYIEHSLKPISDFLISVADLDQNVAGDIFESV